MKARIKEKLQAYLRGEREGFSLVELIIVIAIMAILIGVIALAVIPYLAKSKESKDLSTLDNISSALKTGVADAKVNNTSDVIFEYDGTDPTTQTTDADKVKHFMYQVLGKGSVKLQANCNNGAKVYCLFNASANKLYVFASTDGTVANCTTSEYNETGFKVASGAFAADASGKAFAVGN